MAAAGYVRQRAGEDEKASSISLHGEQAALRRAIGELIFFAGVNDLERCQKIVSAWGIKLDDNRCADYDRRTPLHVAAAEGAYSVCEWLLDHGADVNALDRFQRTALEEAVRGNFAEICQLLTDNGAKLCEDGNLVALADSSMASIVNLRRVAGVEFGIEAEWEVSASELTILNKLGEGEFGEVFKARYNGTYVAVKQLKSSDQIALGDFRTEMSTLRKLHHPNAVQFLGACTRKRPYLIVTELMSCSLATAFNLVFSLTLRRQCEERKHVLQVEIALEFARGMAYMHSRKPVLIHRDLKPANIMIGGSSFMLQDTNLLLNSAGTVKVADFGLSKTLPKHSITDSKQQLDLENSRHRGDMLADKYTLTGETGSYRYMAPEVFLHEPYNTKVDVYSFAMICYQLFEGRLPFEGSDAVSAAKHAAMHKQRPAFPPLTSASGNRDIREQLRGLVRKCWSHEIHSRPDFVEISSLLEGIIDKLGPRKPSSGLQTRKKGCCAMQ